ncbi:phosphatase PAP2 family protein [Legionella cincinnatiensis]|uniref:PAP2 superfamily n=1 Tax=Legionella cincinnatiensis TaxID=28085 RepID=A0A378IK50_9GAMM|nr:phosphatase PAP2 family protein [Legionella cincinnatiensis]KTC83221.1 PAP2 superfamily protein [Legionella cincinnatiensis]STX35647.1 PAP2 superfamily [Legionella cincinnatiensis]
MKLLEKYAYHILILYLPFSYRLIGMINNQFQLARTWNTTTILDELFNDFICYKGIWVFIYISYFLLMIFPVFLKKKERYLMARRVFLMSSFAHFCFLLFPTSTIRWSSTFLASPTLDHQLLSYIYSVDINTNCFPTLHAAHVLLISFYLSAEGKMKYLIYGLRGWAVLIALSTVVTRQHSVIDVVGAVLLAAIFYRVERHITSWNKKVNIEPLPKIN